MWGDQRVSCVLCVYFTISTLICMAVLCRAIQSSVQELTEEICIVYIQVSPPLEIAGCWWEITSWNPVIG
ncbi:unnamed protein product, partial [Staurois parvus]